MHGLHCSIMERLQTLPAYANDRAGRISTYLSKNYRSHPALVRLLARISYENKLSSVAPTDKVMALQVPVVVLGVYWRHRAHGRTPSPLTLALTHSRVPRIRYNNSRSGRSAGRRRRLNYAPQQQEWEKRGTKKAFPMLFCSLEGSCEEREGDSPSYFNRTEATTILALVKSLLSSCADAITEEEVGSNNNRLRPSRT